MSSSYPDTNSLRHLGALALSEEVDGRIQRKQAAEQVVFSGDWEVRTPILRKAGKPLVVETILRSVLKAKGLDKKMAAYRWVKHWEEIVGTGISKRTRPRSLKNGILTIEVTDSAWAQELQFRREIIIGRLGRFVDNHELVKDLRFTVKGMW